MTRGDSPTVGGRSPAQAPRRQIILTTQTLRGCFLTALLVAACAPAMATQISVDPRVEEEVARGRSRVLVELRVPDGVRPEEERRQAIARAQGEGLSGLSGTDFTLVRRFASTPFLALEIGPSALAALRTMGDVVVRVIADAVLPPAGGSTPRR